MRETIDRSSWRPILLNGEHPAAQIEDLQKKNPSLDVIDQYSENLKELFLLRNPIFRFQKDYELELQQFIKSHFGLKNSDVSGNWFYYPWLNCVVHFLPEEMHQELRTGRNLNLVTAEEQNSFYGAVIGILGMSVGSHVAETITMTGGAKHIKIADPDTLSGDNLNRIRSGFHGVGTRKVILVARRIYEYNPYAHVELFEAGLTEENLDHFLGGDAKLDILVEEMDHPYLKLKVRQEARRRNIPVVMGTDNGDGVIIDVERFDLDPTYPVLHGLIGNMTAEELKNLPPEDLPKTAARIAGANLAVPRMLQSVTEVGQSLYSWPQLGTAANLCGSVVSYLARRIVNKDTNINSGRYQVNLDSIFESDYGRKFFSRKRTFFNFVKIMKSRKENFNSDQPVPEGIDSKIWRILNTAVYAPSGDNSQPWRFKIGKDSIQVINVPDRDNSILNFEQHGSYVAQGGLIENIAISASQVGLKPDINLFPNKIGDVVADITFHHEDVERDELFDFIKERSTNRRPYQNTPFTQDERIALLRSSKEVGTQSNIEIRLLEDSGLKKKAGAAGSSIEQVILEDKKLHQLLFKEVRWTEKEEQEKKSGLYIETMEFKPPQKFMFKLASKWAFMKFAIKLGLPKFIAKDDAKLYATGSAFGALILKNNNPEDYVNAGRVMQRLWLRATALNLYIQPITALAFVAQRVLANKADMLSSEHRDIIKKQYNILKELFNVSNETIVMPFRIGHTDPPTARSSRKTPDILM